MKKLISVLTIAIVCTTVSYKSYAQSYFAGTVKFETKYEGDIDPQKHIPHEETFTIFENNVKESFYNGVQNQIHNGDSVTIMIVLDIPGYGCVGKIISKEVIEADMLQKSFFYEERTDSKTICGYECKGYDVTMVTDDDDEETKYIVYTTKEIGKDDNINVFKFPELSGYPLYIAKESNGVKTITQAKEVKKGKVKAVDFLIQSNCKICTTEEEWGLEMMRYNRHVERLQKQ